MPRPKVQPDQRKRVAQACLQCKASKKKCNASLPCSHCVRRGQGDSCQFPNDGDIDIAGRSTQLPPAPHKRASIAAGEKRPLEESPHTTRDFASTAVLTSSDVVLSPDVTSQGSRKGEAPNSTRPRMLSNTRGEQLYIGGAASLSFLQLVRETVTQVIGTSEISEYSKKNQMLEVDASSDDGDDQQPNVNGNIRQQCLNQFFLASSGLIDVTDRQEATQLIASDNDSVDAFRAAIGLTILAIGAQGLAASQDITKTKHSAFKRAQQLAFSGMLENPSLDMTRAFLLMSFYMIGACRRNAGFMYIGIAARSALALGLHNTESYKVLNIEQRTLRHKTWKSLVCLDQAVSSILGRAPATSPQRDAEDRSSDAGAKTDDDTNSALQASYQLALLVDDITGRLYGSQSVSVEAAETYLQTLRNWSENLPPDLRLSEASQTNAKYTDTSMVASLHVSAFYYFSVMLITRPFLIADLTRNLAMSQGVRPNIITEEDELESGKLASSCVNAAIYMAQTCAHMLEMNTLPRDMRLLKAWVFAAGLVLGFQIFGDKDQDVEVERAFASTRNVLKHFAEKSPQAAHYFDILTYLSNAINKQRQIRESRKRRRTEPLVDRIMNLGGQDNSGPPVHSEFDFHIPEQAILPDSTFDLSFANNLELDPQLMQQDFNNIMFGWDNSSLSLWDQFPFEVGNMGSPGLNTMNTNGP